MHRSIIISMCVLWCNVATRAMCACAVAVHQRVRKAPKTVAPKEETQSEKNGGEEQVHHYDRTKKSSVPYYFVFSPFSERSVFVTSVTSCCQFLEKRSTAFLLALANSRAR